jgi:hypothetical protein
MTRTSPKPPKNKRKSSDDLFYLFRSLSERLCAELLPPRPQGPRTSAEALDNFAAGRPDPRVQWDQRRKELELKVTLCRHIEPSEFNEVPWQLEDLQDCLRQEFGCGVTLDEAIGFVLAHGGVYGEIERETWQYIAKEWDRRRPILPEKKIREYLDRREVDSFIRNVKTLLRGEYGWPAGKADDFIAAALGLPSGNTLRQRLQRGRRP